jgi:hypothetical protein
MMNGRSESVSIACVAILCWLAPAVAAAQAAGRDGFGYAFGAPGVASGEATTFHAGGGGEMVLGSNVGMGAELGYVGGLPLFGQGFGLVSTNVSYHFASTSEEPRLRPFVTSGPTLVFGARQLLWNVGGGFHYWVTPRWGLRVEVRDHFLAGSSGSHLWGARFGVAWRERT